MKISLHEVMQEKRKSHNIVNPFVIKRRDAKRAPNATQMAVEIQNKRSRTPKIGILVTTLKNLITRAKNLITGAKNLITGAKNPITGAKNLITRAAAVPLAPSTPASVNITLANLTNTKDIKDEYMTRMMRKC